MAAAGLITEDELYEAEVQVPVAEFFLVRYHSGQMDQTVNLAAQAFDGSNPSLTTN